MHLTILKLHHFRNHVDSFFEFGESTNVLLGDNGHGKTNVIEAISYLCLTKSFYASSDSLVLNFESDFFEVEGTFVSDHGMEQHVRVAYARQPGEKICTINKHHVEPFSSIVGKFPIVICSPEHSPITSGGPLERRKFVDFIISQSSAVYFRTLLEYRHILKHRNKILLDGKLMKRDVAPLLEPWDDQLVHHGSYLISRRKQFIEEFQEYISSAYHHLVGTEEEPAMEYKPAQEIPFSLERDIQDALRVELREKQREEKRTGTSMVGPHRDEFVLKINGLELRKFASQGQHKTFLISLKMGEFFYLKDRCHETPILLLDDVFSELDDHRADHLLQFVGTISQTFITSTNSHLLTNNTQIKKQNKFFLIQNGTAIEQKTVAA